ncbi:MAG: RdgB/HAM1 family non-canonical purine NTP pyrophosphatase [Calditrichaeota bacterium]|nr:MAG: RdgB/HAM1 family non-canonical purine NTP pyrophosphatase [Calditrichota bacterium]
MEENAVKKARTLHEFSGLPTIADDTGLEVDYLNGRPGVFSSRYASEHASYEENVRKLLADLEGVPREKRQARFRCVVAFCDESQTRTFEGVCEGEILGRPKGQTGFGYDPVFWVPAYGLTFAEMPVEQKNRISHRGEAFRKLKAFLESDHGS